MKIEAVILKNNSNSYLATITTEHVQSSHDIPIVLLNGEVIDYAEVKEIHLTKDCSNVDSDEIDDGLWFRIASKLIIFGVRVVRQKIPWDIDPRLKDTKMLLYWH
jgi:hypothetical protein